MEGEAEVNSKTGTIGTINVTNESSIPDLTGQVHQLPCSIKRDGPAPVSHYFKPKPTGVEVEGLRVEEAHFRGRKMHGTTIPLPPGYAGFVLRKGSIYKAKAHDDDDMSEQRNSNCWEMKARFDNVTYWNHDSLPSPHDAFVRSLHWLSVAQALHKPVTAEDLASTSISLEKK